MQGRIVQQRREFGGVGHGQRLKLKPLSKPASVKVDHLSTIAAFRYPVRGIMRAATSSAAMHKHTARRTRVGSRWVCHWYDESWITARLPA